MTLNKIKLAIIILLLLIAGCIEKDELTLPVKIHLKIGIAPYTPYNYDDYEYLGFGKSYIRVQRIRFEGEREAGEDVFFETDPKINLQTLEFGREPATISVFDIPQGIYNYMKWDINLKRITTAGIFDENDTDSLHIGLVISGSYESLNERDEEWGEPIHIPFIIAIDDTEQFSVMSHDPEGNSSIVLSGNKNHEAILLLAPLNAFLSISRESIEEAADISRDNGHQIIMISRNENEDLYEILLYRIMLSAKVIVK
jgi:hypothetical protein